MTVKEKNMVRAFAPTINHISAPINIAGLLNKMLKALHEREVQVLKMRFGLDKYEKHTLEAIGQEFGITRERVRQIENAAITRLSEVLSADLSQILGQAEKILSARGGVLTKNNMLRELLTCINSDLEADMHYLELALMTSINIVTVHNTIKFHPYYCLSSIGTTAVMSAAKSVIGKLKKKNDAMTSEELQKVISSETNFAPSEQTVINICKISKDLKVTEDGRVGLFKWVHINPRNIHDKIVFVMKRHGKPMHFQELTESIRKNAFDDKTINVQAVHNELIRNDQFVLIGRGIYALSEWGYKPGTVADVIVGILKEHGPLDKETIIKMVFQVRQVKKITIQLNLKNKQLFERVGRSTYGLKG